MSTTCELKGFDDNRVEFLKKLSIEEIADIIQILYAENLYLKDKIVNNQNHEEIDFFSRWKDDPKESDDFGGIIKHFRD